MPDYAVSAFFEARRLADEVDKLGYAVLEGVMPAEQTAALIPAFDEAIHGRNGGVHNGLSFDLGRGVASRLSYIGRTIAGESAVAIRVLFFDKLPERNWVLPLHQDTAVPVHEKVEAPGYSVWSLKDGVHHVRAPASVLEKVIAVRLHLDDCTEDNGPLAVLPGTHREGELTPAEISRAKGAVPELRLLAQAGCVILMRPLLLHGSPRSKSTGHRRVVHVEYAPINALPKPLMWPAAQGVART